MIEAIDINLLKTNPNNPRLIKDDKFKKLVKSIMEFPTMLMLRPLIVNNDLVVLAGNMRLKACKEVGLKEVPVIKASNLTKEQEAEFLIKDNISSGSWDFDELANEWNDFDLINWGLEIPKFESETVEDLQEENFVKISIEANNNAFIEMSEKLQNLCDEYSAIMKVK
jgi:hypothetical protein